MNIRSFDWRDIPALHRYRNQSVFLHSALVLTRGPRLFTSAILSSLTPATGFFTSVGIHNGDTDETLIGQVVHTPGSQLAQLTFLAPDDALYSTALPPLLEHLSAQIVERGSFRLLADADERTLAFEALRKASFAIYARQRNWKLNQFPQNQPPTSAWKFAVERDLIPVRSLYHNLVPGLVQQVESFPKERLHGMVLRQGEDLLAYVELKYGPRGIWVQPFIHPDAEDVVNHLCDLLQNLPYRRGRPIYLCVRSYQSWLESAIKDLGAEPGPRQAVMVKHMALPQKAVRMFALPSLESGQPEATAPFAQTQLKSGQQKSPHEAGIL